MHYVACFRTLSIKTIQALQLNGAQVTAPVINAVVKGMVMHGQ